MTTTTKNNVTMEAIPIMMATITTNGFSDQSLATTTTKYIPNWPIWTSSMIIRMISSQHPIRIYIQ